MGSRNHPQWNIPVTARFTVGRDHHGWWVVQDRLGCIGGLFANEQAALHFASDASERHPETVARAPDGMLVEPFEADGTKSPVQGHGAIGHHIVAHNTQLRRA